MGLGEGDFILADSWMKVILDS